MRVSHWLLLGAFVYPRVNPGKRQSYYFLSCFTARRARRSAALAMMAVFTLLRVIGRRSMMLVPLW